MSEVTYQSIKAIPLSKFYIQSKTGYFNSSIGLPVQGSLHALRYLRKLGSYAAQFKGRLVEVPFEEIKYIEEMKETR